MANTEGHTTVQCCKPRPHSEHCSCQCGCCAAELWLSMQTTWAEVCLSACLKLTTYSKVSERWTKTVGNDRLLGQSVSCHSVPITTSLMSKPRFFGFFKLLHAPGAVLEASWQRNCKGKSWRESRNEVRALFPRCSWLPSAPEDLSEHFQNKEIVCVGAQIANPRMYAHLHKDRDTLTHCDIKKCYFNSFKVPI